MEKRRSNFFLTFMLVGTLMSVGFVFLASYKMTKPIQSPQSMASEITPEVKKTATDETVPAPDGKATLYMHATLLKNGMINQTFSVSTDNNKTPVRIFSKEVSKDNLISIPYNTFSPNDKYVLLQYKDSEGMHTLVVRTDGRQITRGSQSVEVEKSFYEKYSGFKITDVTGWAGDVLVVVNTNYSDGKTGPSWWFDLTNFSFIRLSTRFN